MPKEGGRSPWVETTTKSYYGPIENYSMLLNLFATFQQAQRGQLIGIHIYTLIGLFSGASHDRQHFIRPCHRRGSTNVRGRGNFELGPCPNHDRYLQQASRNCFKEGGSEREVGWFLNFMNLELFMTYAILPDPCPLLKWEHIFTFS